MSFLTNLFGYGGTSATVVGGPDKATEEFATTPSTSHTFVVGEAKELTGTFYTASTLRCTHPMFRGIIPAGAHNVELVLEGDAKFGTLAQAEKDFRSLSNRLVIAQNGQFSHPDGNYGIVALGTQKVSRTLQQDGVSFGDVFGPRVGSDVELKVLVDEQEVRTVSFSTLSKEGEEGVRPGRVRHLKMHGHQGKEGPEYDVQPTVDVTCMDCTGDLFNGCLGTATAGLTLLRNGVVGTYQTVRHPVDSLRTFRTWTAAAIATEEQRARLTKLEDGEEEEVGKPKASTDSGEGLRRRRGSTEDGVAVLLTRTDGEHEDGKRK